MNSKRKCTIVVGNGFSQSFINHCRLDKKIITQPMIPPPDHVLYTSYDDCDTISNQPLWSQYMFPELWDAWTEVWDECKDDTKCFWYLCQVLADAEKESGLLPSKEGTVNIWTKFPSYQLRAYLFELFRAYDSYLRGSMTISDITSWLWFLEIGRLIRFFDTTLVSFNYDCIAEHVFETAGASVISHVKDFLALSKTKGQFDVRLYKPHGSISQRCFSDFGLGPSKWRSDVVFDSCAPGTYAYIEYPPIHFPTAPDLIPPGFAGKHTLYSSGALEKAVCRAFNSADIIVWCGLSARFPDTEEVDKYLSCIPKRAHAIHVGLDRDRNCEASQLMKKYCASYQFYRGDGDAEVPFVSPYASSLK